MQQEQTPQGVKTSSGSNRAWVVSAAAAIVVMGSGIYKLVPPLVESIKEQQYVLSHLDSTAVSPRESPFTNDYFFREGEGVYYEDTDEDGDYESILHRKNSDGEVVKLPIRMGLEGKIEFLNLSETAVDPLHIPKNPWGLIVDYINIDGDDKLESVTYFGLNKENPQRMKIELIKGKYVLSNL